MKIRKFKRKDLPRLREITIEAFDGVSIDQNIEKEFGPLAGTGWQERKASHIDNDVAANPNGAFVIEINGEVVGYVTCRLYRHTKTGHILNLAVDKRRRGQGLGKVLVQTALDYFRKEGMSFAKIETLEQNDIGLNFYPKVGFREVARQVYYFMELGEEEG